MLLLVPGFLLVPGLLLTPTLLFGLLFEYLSEFFLGCLLALLLDLFLASSLERLVELPFELARYQPLLEQFLHSHLLIFSFTYLSIY